MDEYRNACSESPTVRETFSPDDHVLCLRLKIMTSHLKVLFVFVHFKPVLMGALFWFVPPEVCFGAITLLYWLEVSPPSSFFPLFFFTLLFFFLQDEIKKYVGLL